MAPKKTSNKQGKKKAKEKPKEKEPEPLVEMIDLEEQLARGGNTPALIN